MDEIIDLGPVPVAESRGHSTAYYWDLWIEYLSSKNIGYQINYSSSSHIAAVLLDGVRVFKIPCQSRRVVKGYYIAFRMCGDDFELLKRYLGRYNTIRGLSDESTPEQNEEFELGVDLDLVRRRRNCCTIS
jgi:hypothetical protein